MKIMMLFLLGALAGAWTLYGILHAINGAAFELCILWRTLFGDE